MDRLLRGDDLSTTHLLRGDDLFRESIIYRMLYDFLQFFQVRFEQKNVKNLHEMNLFYYIYTRKIISS